MYRCYIGSCRIENEGLKHLAKANWPKLLRLNICKQKYYVRIKLHRIKWHYGTKSQFMAKDEKLVDLLVGLDIEIVDGQQNQL